MIIAVDGPAASGKGTLAKRLAEHFGLPMLDTGLLYRAVGQRMHDHDLDLGDGAAATRVAGTFSRAWLDDDRLRDRRAATAASRVAAHPGVRAALRAFQVAFAHQPGGAVLDGRDIGTVIAPDATVKLWITATPAARARRRYLEFMARGESASEADILADLLARDARDAPNMVPAADAHLLDTTDLDKDSAFEAALALVEKARAACG